MSRNTPNLIITIEATGRRIRIGLDVLKILGMPPYVCLYQTEKRDSIAIGPCDGKNVMSFQVPEKILRGEKCDYKINSKPFVSMIVEANKLEAGKPYRLNGVYREDRNLVTFSVGQVTP